MVFGFFFVFPRHFFKKVMVRGPSQVSQWQRIRLPVQEMQVQCLGQEDLLEKEMATHSSTLAWRIPWTEEPGGLQSTRSDMTAMEHAHLKKKKKMEGRKGEKENRKKADRKKERKGGRKEESRKGERKDRRKERKWST